MGLGKEDKERALYLSVAGGYIWNRKADINDPDYAKQEYTDAKGETQERTGARYPNLSGYVTGVEFRTHKQYGESINVKITDEDEKFIISISTNNRYSQDMMKALLKADLNEEILISPYDFTDNESGKRVQGISFKQDGNKIDLKTDVPDEFQKEKDWFKNADKKKVKRYFEDLSDWFVGEIEEKVIPTLSTESSKQTDKPSKPAAKKEVEPDSAEKPAEIKEEVKKEVPASEPETETPKRITPLKMKSFLKGYIEENYEDKTLPKLDKDQLKVWYDLAQEMEELPFPTEANSGAEVDEDDIQAQLDALAG